MIFVLVYVRALEKKSQLYVKVVVRIGFLVFYFHPEGEMTENICTVTENILRKKIFIQLLGLRQNVIAGTIWAILSEQYHSILPAWVANHSAGFGSFCRSPSLPYNKVSYKTFCSFATVNYMILHQDLLTDYITHTYALS